MSFPWETPAQRRKREADEDAARIETCRAMFRQTFRHYLKSINKATDSEIDAAMAEIHRQQRERNVLRPARRARRTE